MVIKYWNKCKNTAHKVETEFHVFNDPESESVLWAVSSCSSMSAWWGSSGRVPQASSLKVSAFCSRSEWSHTASVMVRSGSDHSHAETGNCCQSDVSRFSCMMDHQFIKDLQHHWLTCSWNYDRASTVSQMAADSVKMVRYKDWRWVKKQPKSKEKLWKTHEHMRLMSTKTSRKPKKQNMKKWGACRLLHSTIVSAV